ncbi:MAG: glycosyltransferase family 39 protein [Lachnospiraceae bacterium]|nr:glycosyltransferase family 39 protein [Lachnospiraceae bacterium]
MNMKKKNKKEIIILTILWLVLIFYTLIGTFFGVDLGDTGYHVYAYERLYTQSNYLSFTAYFTYIIGHIWVSIFGSLGLWGLNLLEALFEIIIAIFVYKIISKKLGKIQTLVGLVIAIGAFDTYLNVFNYHQFNVFLLLIIMLSEYKAITENKYIYSGIAGLFLAIIIFSRTGSVTAITTVFLYIVWALYMDVNKGFLRKHLLAFGTAALAGTVLITTLLFVTNQLSLFINNVFRLGELANTEGSSYNIFKLLNSFVIGNFNAFAQGVVFVSTFFFFMISIGMICKQEKMTRKIVNICMAIVVMIMGCYLIKYSYDMNPAPSWAQMTTGPSFTIGVLYVISVICFLYNILSNSGDKEIALLSVISILLPFYTIAGSNTGTKHAVLAFWIAAPIAFYSISQLLCEHYIYCQGLLKKLSLYAKKNVIYFAVGICIVGFMYKYVDLCYRTFNFDSIKRTELVYGIDNSKVKWLKTTKREADSVNGVLNEIEEIDQEYPLIVFGGSLLFYSLTDRDSFVQPWFSNSTYSNDTLKSDLSLSAQNNDKLPIVIYGRTNNYFGYGEDVYENLLKAEKNNNYQGKKEILKSFLKEYGYKMQYINDYYIVLLPPSIASQGSYKYSEYKSYF